jgi:hypothetical protein
MRVERAQTDIEHGEWRERIVFEQDGELFAIAAAPRRWIQA